MEISVIFKGPKLYLAFTPIFYFLGEKVYPKVAKSIDHGRHDPVDTMHNSQIDIAVAQYIIIARPRDVNIGLRTTCTEAKLFSGTSMCKESNSKDPQLP